MTNFEAFERFDQAHSTIIKKLFWIAGSLENSDLKDFIEEMEDSDFQKCFPDIYKSKYFKEYRHSNETLQALIDCRKFGLIAEIHIPTADNFTFKNGKPSGWSVMYGVCQVRFVYAETLEELVSGIEKVTKKVFQEFVKDFKKIKNK